MTSLRIYPKAGFCSLKTRIRFRMVYKISIICSQNAHTEVIFGRYSKYTQQGQARLCIRRMALRSKKEEGLWKKEAPPGNTEDFGPRQGFRRIRWHFGWILPGADFKTHQIFETIFFTTHLPTSLFETARQRYCRAVLFNQAMGRVNIAFLYRSRYGAV